MPISQFLCSVPGLIKIVSLIMDVYSKSAGKHQHVLLCLLISLLMIILINSRLEMVTFIALSSANRSEKVQQLVGDLPFSPFNMSSYDSIFLYHTRKAGGSTMRRWLRRVANKHNLTLKVQEGYPLQESDFHNKSRTLYITTLRDPVERAISSYYFEGQWLEAGKNRTKESAIGFKTWTEIVNIKPRGRLLWHCASDCYCKWFGSSGEGGVWNRNVTNAMERLKHFDMVLQTERLKEKNYTANLQILLSTKEIPIGHSNAKRAAWNAYEVTESDLAFLEEINQNDRVLYAAVFGLTT